MQMRKIRQFDEDFNSTDFPDVANDIYLEANRLLEEYVHYHAISLEAAAQSYTKNIRSFKLWWLRKLLAMNKYCQIYRPLN